MADVGVCSGAIDERAEAREVCEVACVECVESGGSV